MHAACHSTINITLNMSDQAAGTTTTPIAQQEDAKAGAASNNAGDDKGSAEDPSSSSKGCPICEFIEAGPCGDQHKVGVQESACSRQAGFLCSRNHARAAKLAGCACVCSGTHMSPSLSVLCPASCVLPPVVPSCCPPHLTGVGGVSRQGQGGGGGLRDYVRRHGEE